MVMTKCRECSKDVSDQAEICPGCGVKNPSRHSKGKSVDFAVTVVLIAFTYFYFLYDGDETDSSKVHTERSEVTVRTPSCEQGSETQGKYYVTSSNVNFRTRPTGDSALVVNETATRLLGSTQYRTLFSSTVLQGYCETEHWLYGKIIEADGAPVDWDTGWVHKNFISKEPSEDYLAGLIWNIDEDNAFSAQEKVLLRKGALKILNDEPSCQKLITGYRSVDRPDTYFVTCRGYEGSTPFNIWFTPSQLESNESLALPKPHPEDLSRLTCIEMIKQHVTHPSTLDIHDVYGYSSFVHSDQSRTVRQQFSAKNGFNLELEFTAYCVFKPDGELDFRVNETSS